MKTASRRPSSTSLPTAILPLTLGILIDTSPSQQRVLGMEQEVGGAFLARFCAKKIWPS